MSLRLLGRLELPCRDALFPVLPVEGPHAHAAQIDAVQATHVHVDLVGMRARYVEAADPARPTEVMPREARAEAIRHERVLTRLQTERVLRNDPVQIPLPRADRAV